MYYEMVKDTGLASFLVYLYNSTRFSKTITQRILKKKHYLLYTIVNIIVHVLYVSYHCIVHILYI